MRSIKDLGLSSLLGKWVTIPDEPLWWHCGYYCIGVSDVNIYLYYMDNIFEYDKSLFRFKKTDKIGRDGEEEEKNNYIPKENINDIINEFMGEYEGPIIRWVKFNII